MYKPTVTQNKKGDWFVPGLVQGSDWETGQMIFNTGQMPIS